MSVNKSQQVTTSRSRFRQESKRSDRHRHTTTRATHARRQERAPHARDTHATTRAPHARDTHATRTKTGASAPRTRHARDTHATRTRHARDKEPSKEASSKAPPRPPASISSAKAAWWKAAGQLPAREHELFRAQEHAVQVAEQHEHDRDRDQVALVELELHAVGSSALKLFAVNTSQFQSSCSRPTLPARCLLVCSTSERAAKVSSCKVL